MEHKKLEEEKILKTTPGMGMLLLGLVLLIGLPALAVALGLWTETLIGLWVLLGVVGFVAGFLVLCGL